MNLIGKLSKEDFEKIRAVIELRRKGYRFSEIFFAINNNEELSWDINLSNFEQLWGVGNEIITDDFEKEKDSALAQSFSDRKHMFTKALEQGDIGNAEKLRVKMDEFFGLAKVLSGMNKDQVTEDKSIDQELRLIADRMMDNYEIVDE